MSVKTENNLPTNVLIVTAWSPALPAGGVGTVIRVLGRKLKHDHGVFILVRDWQSPNLTFAEVDTATIQIKIFTLRLRSMWNKRNPAKSLIMMFLLLPNTIWQLRKLVRENRIDAVHLHFADSYQFYFPILRFFGGPPYIVTLHGSDTASYSDLPRIDRTIVRWILRGANRVTAVSDWLARRAASTFSGIGDIESIYNGVDVLQIQEAVDEADRTVAEEGLPSRYFVMVANVTYYKAPDVAIRAWSILANSRPDLHLVIVGEARDAWDECKALIRDQGTADRIHMLGSRPHKTTLQIIKNALGLVFPSRSEGLPCVLLEAGAIGLPVVCTAIGPFLEVVTDGTSGLVVEPEDSEGLAAAVERLDADPALRRQLADKLHEIVCLEFSADAMAQGYARVYQEIQR